MPTYEVAANPSSYRVRHYTIDATVPFSHWSVWDSNNGRDRQITDTHVAKHNSVISVLHNNLNIAYTRVQSVIYYTSCKQTPERLCYKYNIIYKRQTSLPKTSEELCYSSIAPCYNNWFKRFNFISYINICKYKQISAPSLWEFYQHTIPSSHLGGSGLSTYTEVNYHSWI